MGKGFTEEFHKQLHPNYIKGSLTLFNEENMRKAMCLKTPSVVNIELTNHCNARCTFCTNPTLAVRTFMERKVFEDTINEIATYTNLQTLNWHKDGETLLHPKVEDWMQYAREKLPNTWFHMNTNGIILQQKHRVCKYLDDVTVSIDAFGVDNYIKRKQTNAYNRVVDGVLYCHDKYRNIRVKIMEGNDTSPQEVIAFLRFWESHGIPTQVTGYHSWSGKVNVKITDETVPERFACPLLWYAVAIECTGNINLCNVGDDTSIIGKVGKKPICTQWYKEVKKVRKNHINEIYEPKVCEQCVVWASGQDPQELR